MIASFDRLGFSAGLPDRLAAALVVALAATFGVLAGLDPPTAIAGGVGLGLLLLALNDLSVGLAILVFAVFFEQSAFAGGAVTLTKVMGIVVAASWFAVVTSGRLKENGTIFSAHPGASYILGLFLAWAAISVVWADGEGFATDLSRYLLNTILFVIVYSAVRSRRGVGVVVGGFIAGATVTALYGIVARPVVDPSEAARLTSTVGDPNELAAAMLAGVALAVGVALGARRATGLRLIAGMAAAAMLVAFLLTGSRGGLVGLGVALAATAIIAGRWRPQAIAVVALVAMVAGVFFAFYAPDDIRDRVIAATNGESRSREGRDTIWVVALRMAVDRPVTGVGLASFDDDAVSYAVEPGRTFRTDEVIDNVSVAHNTYLQIWSELGLVGLALFLSLVGFAMWAAYQAVRVFERLADLPMEVLSRSLIVAIAGVLSADFFISQNFSKVLWLLLGLGPALLGVARLLEADRSAQADRAISSS